ncbi:MAG: 4a-hydroxytetrahydrobiopterin dehydratase [Burkholderiales bacterium]|nr:4a-hydroxytetrahydrobiopterin dehydratase [Burkholderiales bacterium]
MSSAPQAPARRALGPTEIVTQLAQHPGWTLQGDGPELAISRRYEFGNFHEVMAFANAVAWIAQQRDHHPDLLLNYRHCTVSWRTHDAGGITRIDFDCAAQVDALRGHT